MGILFLGIRSHRRGLSMRARTLGGGTTLGQHPSVYHIAPLGLVWTMAIPYRPVGASMDTPLGDVKHNQDNGILHFNAIYGVF